MSRFRLLPTPAQQVALLEHCEHARFVWNLAVEQQQFWQPGRRAPGYSEQSARAEAPGRPGGVALPAPTPAPPRRPPYRHTKELLTDESIESCGLPAQTLPVSPFNLRSYARSGAARKVPVLRNRPDTASSRSPTRRSWAGSRRRVCPVGRGLQMRPLDPCERHEPVVMPLSLNVFR